MFSFDLQVITYVAGIYTVMCAQFMTHDLRPYAVYLPMTLPV